MMELKECDVEWTYFIPKSGLDAANYLVIATKIKIAAHEDVHADKLHFVDELRDIIVQHKQSRTEIEEDGSVRKSTSIAVSCMEDFLQRLEEADLRLCFRMWSISTAQELVQLALAEAEDVDTDGNSDEAQRDPETSGYGAVVAFVIVPHSLPVLIPDSGIGHCEISVRAPNWNDLPDLLSEV